MHITVFNLKGGQGKTTIALALAMLYNFYIITNDEYSPIDSVLDTGKVTHLAQDEDLPPTTDRRSLIYDFNGYPDQTVIDAVTLSKWVIIPFTYKSPLDLQTTIDAIQTVEAYNDNILIVVNQTTKDSFDDACAVLNAVFNYPILEVKDSTAFVRMVEHKQSIEQLAADTALYSYHYQKPLEQVEAIAYHILM